MTFSIEKSSKFNEDKNMRMIHIGIELERRISNKEKLKKTPVGEKAVCCLLNRLTPNDVVFGYYNPVSCLHEAAIKTRGETHHGVMFTTKNGGKKKYNHAERDPQIGTLGPNDVAIQINQNGFTLFLPKE